MRFVTKKRVAAAVAALAIGGSGVAAYAYFTGSAGSGSGSAHTGSAASWTVGALTFSGGPVYPGSGSETATYTVTNAGGGNQALTSVTASVSHNVGGDVIAGGSAVTGCTASWYTATAGAPSPAIGAVIAKNGTATGTVTESLTESNSSQDLCKGVTPDITVTAS
jgi:hypothetical protein